jgi:hypothetical protein
MHSALKNVWSKIHKKYTNQGEKPMSLPSQTAQKTSQAAQKMKPLFIAVGVIALAVLFISQAPGFVQLISQMGH